MKSFRHVFQGVKEHKCRICGREFTLLANMKRHILIHTNIRAYQCHLCYKSFVQKQTLKAHMIVHSDIKPYKCKVSHSIISIMITQPNCHKVSYYYSSLTEELKK